MSLHFLICAMWRTTVSTSQAYVNHVKNLQQCPAYSECSINVTCYTVLYLTKGVSYQVSLPGTYFRFLMISFVPYTEKQIGGNHFVCFILIWEWRKAGRKGNSPDFSFDLSIGPKSAIWFHIGLWKAEWPQASIIFISGICQIVLHQ